jgi:PAS domain S-box-containing protein
MLIPPSFFSSLRFRAILLLALIFGIVLIAALYWAAEQRRTDLDAAIKQLGLQAQLIVAQQSEVVRNTQQFLTLIVESGEAERLAVDPNCPELLRRYTKQDPRFASMFIVDLTGHPSCSSFQNAGVIDISDRAYFKKALAGSETAIGEAAIGRATQRWVVPFARTFDSKSGLVQGVFVVTMDLGWINGEFNRGSYPPGTTLGLIDAAGTFLARFPDSENLVGKSGKDFQGFKALTRLGGEGSTTITAHDGVTRIFFFTTFLKPNGNTIYLWIGLPIDAVTARTDRQFAEAMAIALILVTLAASLAWFAIARYLIVPVQAIGQAARKLSSGEYRARTQLQYKEDEIGELARTFDFMAQRLEERTRELAERETFTRVLLDSSPSGLALTTPSGEFRHVTARWSEMLGYAQEELHSVNAKELWVDPLERERMVELVKKDGVARDFEAKFRQKSGAIREALENASYVEAGGERLIATWVHDIGKLKAAEQGLSEALRRQNAIFAASPFGICVYRGEQRVMTSPAFERMFGYEPGELAGKEAGTLFETNEDYVRLQNELRVCFTRGEVYNSEARMERKDGTPFWCRVSAAPLEGEESPTSIVVLYADITKRKAAEEALRSAHAEVDAIFASATAGIVLVRAGRVERCNPRFEAMFGHRAGELLGATVRMFYAATDDEFQKFVVEQRATVDRGEIWRREMLFIRRDRTTFWARLTGQAIERANIARGNVWMVEDVTEEHAAAEALREAKRLAEEATQAKSMFLASMSHEIRTPMNGVLGMLQLLALSRLNTEQKATLDIVRDSGRSLLRVIDDLLDFSKIEAGRLELRPEATSIASLVESALRVYSGVASAKDLTLRASLDPRISPALFVDPLRLRQILNNFISNAIKFTERGNVEVGAVLQERADSRDVVRFYVSDTGVGVAKDAQTKLFQPYVQAAIDTARNYGGTGLGLTICRRLAEMMEGTIEMDSEPGRGTTMTLTLALPIADPSDLPKPDTSSDSAAALVATRRRPPAVEAARAEGTLVLIAEDHPTNRTLLTRLLNVLGYATVAADNGREALQAWNAGGIAAIITDCNMPEMDGYDFARAVRAEEEAGGRGRTPIIACTANVLADELTRCTAAGMDDLVAKPVELERLAKVMEQWLPLPSGAEETPVNTASLAEVSGGDAALEREILADFAATNRADMAILRDALVKHDIAGVARSSHRVKGACRTIGAAALADVCERMEGAARLGDWKAIVAEQHALEREFARLDAWLAPHRNELNEGIRA